VKANRGAAGVDGVSLAAFEQNLKGNLYKIWNRMSSGSYHPPPVRLVEIPKDTGGTRPLGIPTISDRVAQTVAKMVLEPLVEPRFHQDSYGYRPGRSTRWAWHGNVAGKPMGSSIWISGLSLIPFRMISSNVPWPITLTLLGSDCMLGGGFVHPSNVRTGLTRSGRKAPRKEVSPVRCSPTCSCTTRSTCGCIGTIRAFGSSDMLTTVCHEGTDGNASAELRER
jgi:hypothetical protein